jgi:hypothetical protein
MDMLKGFEPFEWKKDILKFKIPLNHEIQIPFNEEMFFYKVGLVPYFIKELWVSFAIPTIHLSCLLDSETHDFFIENDLCSLRAVYDNIHPWYKIIEFRVTYEYLLALLKNIYVQIQVTQHLKENPLKEVNLEHFDEEYDFGFFKDWLKSDSDIVKNKSYFSLNLESLELENVFSTYLRTIDISITYPVYKSMLLSSIVLNQKTWKKQKTAWITYDENFYKVQGVPTYRSFAIILNLSSIIRD